MEGPLSDVKAEPLEEYQEDKPVLHAHYMDSLPNELFVKKEPSDSVSTACWNPDDIDHKLSENTNNLQIKQEVNKYDWEYSAPAASVKPGEARTSVIAVDSENKPGGLPVQIIKLEANTVDDASNKVIHGIETCKQKELQLIQAHAQSSKQSSDEGPIPMAMYRNRTTFDEAKLTLENQDLGNQDEPEITSAMTGAVGHTENNGDERYSECSGCYYRSTNREDFFKHICPHTDRMSYKCLECKYRSSSRKAFTAHVREHIKEKPYKCSQCDCWFADQDRLQQHMRTHPSYNFRCSECDYTTVSHYDFEKHTLSHINRDKKEEWYACSDCGYSSADGSYFGPPISEPNGEDSFKCSFCAYMSNKWSDVARPSTKSKKKPYRRSSKRKT